MSINIPIFNLDIVLQRHMVVVYICFNETGPGAKKSSFAISINAAGPGAKKPSFEISINARFTLP